MPKPTKWKYKDNSNQDKINCVYAGDALVIDNEEEKGANLDILVFDQGNEKEKLIFARSRKTQKFYSNIGVDNVEPTKLEWYKMVLQALFNLLMIGLLPDHLSQFMLRKEIISKSPLYYKGITQ